MNEKGSVNVAENILDWLGSSVTLDDEGEPKTYYHGTHSSFTEFDPKRQGKTAGVPGGFFFTENEEVAREVYAYRKGGRVMEVNLRILKPLGWEDYFQLRGLDQDKETNGGFDAPVNYFDNNFEEVLNFAKSQGFDGIVWPADHDSELQHDLVVVFDAFQIRLVEQERWRERDRG